MTNCMVNALYYSLLYTDVRRISACRIFHITSSIRNFSMLRLPWFVPILLIWGCAASPLETVNDDDLLNLIKTEKYVVVYFTKKDCNKCDEIENELVHLREDLVDSLGAWVVKAISSQMVRLYSPNKEPALVFFRQGIPLLYDALLAKFDDEKLLQTFTDNKEPVVKELTDDTFEHLTQASSGATTGDWLIMFYSTECVDCQRLGAVWEAVGAELKQKMNVARVNKQTSGSSTGRRFNVFEVPTFILFRQGKMYRYQIPKYDVKSFVSFAKDWWKNAHGERVPVPQSPFDDFTLLIANFLRENPWVMKLSSITICVLVIVSVASKLRRKSEVPSKKEK